MSAAYKETAVIQLQDILVNSVLAENSIKVAVEASGALRFIFVRREYFLSGQHIFLERKIHTVFHN